MLVLSPSAGLGYQKNNCKNNRIKLHDTSLRVALAGVQAWDLGFRQRVDAQLDQRIVAPKQGARPSEAVIAVVVGLSLTDDGHNHQQGATFHRQFTSFFCLFTVGPTTGNFLVLLYVFGEGLSAVSRTARTSPKQARAVLCGYRAPCRPLRRRRICSRSRCDYRCSYSLAGTDRTCPSWHMLTRTFPGTPCRQVAAWVWAPGAVALALAQALAAQALQARTRAESRSRTFLWGPPRGRSSGC